MSQRVLKHDDSFAVFDDFGNVPLLDGSSYGMYCKDTRFLSKLDFLIDGRKPRHLETAISRDNTVLNIDLTDAPLPTQDGKVPPVGTTHVLRTKVLWQNCCYERFVFQTFEKMPTSMTVQFRFDADFVDLFEVKGFVSHKRGSLSVNLKSDKAVAFEYRGADGVLRTTEIEFSQTPEVLDRHGAKLKIDLVPNKRQKLYMTMRTQASDEDEKPRMKYRQAIAEARKAMHKRVGHGLQISSSNVYYNETIERARADVALLVTETKFGPYPYAGTPWYSAAFGRDAIITGLQMLWIDPSLSRGILNYLAKYQATGYQAEKESEPGKILHENRFGEMARLGEVVYNNYYGSVDSTPLFLILAEEYLERTQDIDFIREIWPAMEIAAEWMTKKREKDPRGLITYHMSTPGGLLNQGWKDSEDSVFHRDGSHAESPIALCEVQGYVHAAFRAMGKLADILGKADQAKEYAAQSQSMYDSIQDLFWDEEMGFYVLAYDANGKPCRVRSSNAGHLLFTSSVPEDRARILASHLTDSSFFTRWGIRTIPANERNYNPMSYHNGSIWPHDNGLIAAGMGRYGFRDEPVKVLEGIFDATNYLADRRLPELFCGFSRRHGSGPTPYAVACRPQAWAAGAIFHLLQACLGLEIDARKRRVIFHDPKLPEFLEDLTLTDIQVAGESLSVRIRSHDGNVDVGRIGRKTGVKFIVTD